MENKISTLLDSYIIQIEFYKEKVNNFQFEKKEGMSNQKLRDTFLDLATYIDKLNYYENNLRKLKALKNFLDTGMVLAEQRHKMEVTIGSHHLENKTLIDYWASISS